MPNQIRQYPQALSVLPTDAFIIDRVGTGTEYVLANNFIPSTLLWTGAVLYTGSSPPGASQLLGGWNVPVPGLFPDTYATALTYGWGLHVETALPTNPFNITMAQNDTLRATITINTNGTWNYTSTSGAAWPVSVQDRVTLVASSSPDATLNGFFITIAALIT